MYHINILSNLMKLGLQLLPCQDRENDSSTCGHWWNLPNNLFCILSIGHTFVGGSGNLNQICCTIFYHKLNKVVLDAYPCAFPDFVSKQIFFDSEDIHGLCDFECVSTGFFLYKSQHHKHCMHFYCSHLCDPIHQFVFESWMFLGIFHHIFYTGEFHFYNECFFVLQ